MSNRSKVRLLRFWKIWGASGAVASVNESNRRYIAEAKKWLGCARNLSNDNTNRINLMRSFLAEAGSSLSAIGTNEKEVEELLNLGYFAEAKKWLGCARNSSNDNTNRINLMRSFLAEAGSSLSAIGTNEKEVEELLNIK